MAHYAVGRFERGQSGSPYQFVCKKVYPEGPFALLDIKRRRIAPPDLSAFYLFEIEDWHSIDQRSQYVTKIIARLSDIRAVVHEALKSTEWEMVIERGHPKVKIVGGVLKTEYGYFKPRYDKGTRPNGQDEDPMIWFDVCSRSSENPYGDALGTSVAQGCLLCVDLNEIARAKQAFIAKEGLGELFRKHHGF